MLNKECTHLYKYARGLSSYIPMREHNDAFQQTIHQLISRIRPENLCHFIITQTPVPHVFYLPGSGKIIAVNAALIDLLGYSSVELHQKNIIDLFHPDDRRLEQELFHDSYRTQTTYTDSIKRCWKKSQQEVWVVYSSKCAVNERDKTSFVMSTLQDISAYKNTQANNQNLDEQEHINKQQKHE